MRRCGMETVPFSPLHDPCLPDDVDGIYLGGGYPEMYLKELNANRTMIRSLREFGENHLIYGECGGYLFLMESLRDFSGETLPCLGLLPGRAKMNHRLFSLGYREVHGARGMARGHEFHYSSLLEVPEGPPLWHACDMHGHQYECGGVRNRVCGSYIHLYFADAPDLLRALFRP